MPPSAKPTEPAKDRTMDRHLALLVFSVAAGSSGLTAWVFASGRPFWLIGVAVLTLASFACLLGRAALLGPLDALASQCAVVARGRSPHQARRLPTERQDAMGLIARSVADLALRSDRQERHAQVVRRVQDDQLKRAMQIATHKLEKLVYRDPMTNLGNRRFLQQAVPELLVAARASGEPVAFIVVDVNHFKEINDQLGHAAGDQVLTLLADLLRHGIRQSDLTIRLGGDEFLVVMPGPTEARVQQYTQNLTQRFEHQASIRYAIEPRTGLSIGVVWDDGKSDVPTLLHHADQAMYQHKRAGKPPQNQAA